MIKSETMRHIWRILMPSTEYRYRANQILSWLQRKHWTHAWAPPRVINIELASVCNLKCPFCPTGINQLDRPETGFMSWDIFSSIVDDLSGVYPYAFFNLWGESLLHPEFNRFVRYAKDHGFKEISISTNGNVRRNDEWYRELVASELDVIQIAIDGNDQETYSKYRLQGSLDTVYLFIETLLRIKNEEKSERPKIVPVLVVNQFNKPQIPEINSRLKSLGLDILKIRNNKDLTQSRTEQQKSNLNHDDFSCQQDGYGGFFVLKSDGTSQKKINQYSSVIPCPSLWENLYINSHGGYMPCCSSFKQEDVIATIHEFKPLHFWYSRKMRHIRYLNLKDPSKIPACKNCGFIIRRNSTQKP
ncbi:MAG: radical SAM protein [Magnetococcales bacterium]|nr:radical SAM protein [Magnetococcales bacterium]